MPKVRLVRKRSQKSFLFLISICGLVILSTLADAGDDFCISTLGLGFPTKNPPSIAEADEMNSTGKALRFKPGTKLRLLRVENPLGLVEDLQTSKTFWVAMVTLVCDPEEIKFWQRIYKTEESQDASAPDPKITSLGSVVCTVLEGHPVFKTEDGLDEYLNELADWLDAGHSFQTANEAGYVIRDKLVKKGEALESFSDRVRITKEKDFVKGALRMPKIKAKVQGSKAGYSFWVLREALECE
jgi:hypothetical protein